MGGGVCRPSDAFASVQSLSTAAALPVTRAFMQAIWHRPPPRSSRWTPTCRLTSPPSSPPRCRPHWQPQSSAASHRKLASRLFQRYCHPHTATLSYQQLSSLLHDHLCASMLALPALLSGVYASAARLTRSNLRPSSREEQRGIDAAFAAVQKESETAMRRWYQSLLRREEELAREVWRLLMAGVEGKAAGLTEAAFVAGWQTACDAAMAAKEFRPPRGQGGGGEDDEDEDEEEAEAAEDVWAPLQRLSVAETKMEELSQGDDTTVLEATAGDSSPRVTSATTAAPQSSPDDRPAD